MKKIYLKHFCFLSMFLMGIVAYAQQVSGTVSSAEGPLPGATVTVKGTSNGASTDFDGNFTIDAGADDVLVISYVGYAAQEITVGSQTTINVTLESDSSLEEVVVVGYGSQEKKEITSAVAVIDEESFNKGVVNNPTQLLQGKVAGLTIYNRGDDPTGTPTIRLRGLSTFGGNTQPLIVIDGIIGGSLDNVDPNDIADITVLKDGSAAAIYGTRGSSGVILVTTKSGTTQGTKVEYNGQASIAQINNRVKVMTADEFRTAGGTDVGGSTDWLDEVTRDAFTNIHNISLAGATEKTRYRVSTNLRNVQGILDTQEFQRFNSRVNFSTKLLNDKLKVDFNSSYTQEDANYAFREALRYAVLFNPLAPVYAKDTNRTLFPVDENIYGGYFENFGVFDSFNPRAILDQNTNLGETTRFNYGANLNYEIIEGLNVNLNYAETNFKGIFHGYRSTKSHWVANNIGGFATNPLRKGQALFSAHTAKSQLFESYLNYNKEIDALDLSVTAGYSYNLVQDNFGFNFNLGGFPDDSQIQWVYNVGVAQDLRDTGRIGASSYLTPEDKIIAMFGRINLTYDDTYFFNASIRREGSSRFGENNQWGLFPSVGVGADINKFLDLEGVELLKVRFGYGVTGALPGQTGLSQTQFGVNPVGSTAAGGFAAANNPNFAPNKNLKWEEKAEMNLGFEFQTDRLNATLDVYQRNSKDFLFLAKVDASNPDFLGASTQWQNAGELQTQGIELAANYDVIASDDLTWNTGIVFDSYRNELVKWTVEGTNRFLDGNLGAPGQNETNMILVEEGGTIGQIYAPVYTGNVDENGSPILEDLNGDGTVKASNGEALNEDADFKVVGQAYPAFSLGWSNRVDLGNLSISAFFRGAFGHSLVNTYRAFYEPRVASQTSYNLVNTKYADDKIKTAQFSDYYVENADFVRIDNINVEYSFDLPETLGIEALSVSLNAQNPLTITGYTGVNPDPALQDGDNVLAPGIDRRGTYFAFRTITAGLNIKF